MSVHPWEQPLGGESPKAFAAMRAYLELGPGRSLTGLAAALRGGAGRAKASAGGRLRAWCSAFGWVDRAAAYDRHLAAERQRGIDREAEAAGADWGGRVMETMRLAFAAGEALVGAAATLARSQAADPSCYTAAGRVLAMGLDAVERALGHLEEAESRAYLTKHGVPAPGRADPITLPVQTLADADLAGLEAILARAARPAPPLDHPN